MYLRVFCLLLAAVAVSGDGLLDIDYLTLKKISPRPELSDKRLGLWAYYYASVIPEITVTEMALLTSLPGEETMDHVLALGNLSGLFRGTEERDKIKLLVDTHGVWSFRVYWNNETEGYCRTYQNRVSGVEPNGQTHSIELGLKVNARDGSECPEIPLDIKSNFPDLTYEQRLEILGKLRAIDSNTYRVSAIYKGRVYLASMKDKNFQLQKMNELCKAAGGYLLELEDADEQWAVRDFLKELGSFNYYIGGNDVNSEGNFVNYNSQRPMTNVVWQNGEPNNDGNEDCVELRLNGLNDNQCGREHGYLCELPLL